MVNRYIEMSQPFNRFAGHHGTGTVSDEVQINTGPGRWIDEPKFCHQAEQCVTGSFGPAA